jgi:hypothetical protein
MPTPQNLRLRLKLISQFDQLAERLTHGDETALEEAKDRLFGIATACDCDVMSQVFRALAKVLTDMQKTIDDGGFQF